MAGNLDYEIAEPIPGAFVDSLRSIGYTLQTAIADIIDNSISARARNVWLDFHWAGEQSWIRISDDGIGMSEDTLVQSMRLGSISPSSPREKHDLGRFGLGLKTASFAQCRRVTVWSKSNGLPAAVRCWDLDHIQSAQQWRLLRTIDQRSFTRLGVTPSHSHGTVVLWENMDRLVSGTQTENRLHQDSFNRQIETVQKHVAMTFHKLMIGPRSITLWLNGTKIAPWDPFLSTHLSTLGLAQEALHTSSGDVVVRPYVLPHKSRLTDKEFESGGGTRGWNDMQGFYVYRNNRLLVPGDWLGLGFTKDEHYKLARIELHLNNSMDSEWRIDVKKSRARPPEAIREGLRRIARLVRDQANLVYRSRGKVVPSPHTANVVPLWNVLSRNGQTRPVINRDHPAITSVRRDCGDIGAKGLEVLLSLIEETLPVRSRQMPAPIAYDGSRSDAAQYRDLGRTLLKNLIRQGCTREKALQMLEVTEPFIYYPDLVSEIAESEDPDNE